MKNSKKSIESSQPESVEKSVENHVSVPTKAEKKYIAQPIVVLEKVVDRFIKKSASMPNEKLTIIPDNSLPAPETIASKKSGKLKNKHMDKTVSIKSPIVAETKNVESMEMNHPVDSSHS